jgi:predicted nucleic acid-binding protein
VVQLDTSTLIDSFTGAKHLWPVLDSVLEAGERIWISSLVLYKWQRGPRMPEELAIQEKLLPAQAAFPFEAQDARIAADIYRSLPRARSREFDIAIAAIAIRHDMPFWTVNPQDFNDIPRLRLYRPPR